jgi:hypothetical protein
MGRHATICREGFRRAEYEEMEVKGEGKRRVDICRKGGQGF